MKLIFAILSLALCLCAQPLDLGVDITQGPVTINCNYVDLSSWGGVFALAPPAFRCNVTTTSSDVAAVSVTINTEDRAGVAHVYTQETTVEKGYSIVVFATRDTTLLSVSVTEIHAPVVFSRKVTAGTQTGSSAGHTRTQM